MNESSEEPVSGKTLPRRYFTSDEVFATETARLFHDRWFCVGRRGQLAKPGDYFLADVAGESLIISLDEQQQLHAPSNVCRHRGTQLVSNSEGHLPACRVQCRYHRWTYHCDGRLIAAPNMDEQPDFDRGDWPLHTAQIAEWEGFLLVNLSPAPQSVQSAFAPFYERLRPWRVSELRVAHREKYDVATNWKMIFENFNECYHCPSVHPGLNEMSPVDACTNDFAEGPFLGGPMELAAESMTTTLRLAAPVIGTLDRADARRVYYYTLLPNMLFALHPDFVIAWRLEPRSSRQTRVVAEWLFEPETMASPDFDPTPAVDFWDTTNRQDWAICQQSRQGVESKAYQPGPWSSRETMSQAFDAEVLRVLGQKLC
jgi:Rieske 2Fe-2S family protein